MQIVDASFYDQHHIGYWKAKVLDLGNFQIFLSQTSPYICVVQHIIKHKNTDN